MVKRDKKISERLIMPKIISTKKSTMFATFPSFFVWHSRASSTNERLKKSE